MSVSSSFSLSLTLYAYNQGRAANHALYFAFLLLVVGYQMMTNEACWLHHSLLSRNNQSIIQASIEMTMCAYNAVFEFRNIT